MEQICVERAGFFEEEIIELELLAILLSCRDAIEGVVVGAQIRSLAKFGAKGVFLGTFFLNDTRLKRRQSRTSRFEAILYKEDLFLSLPPRFVAGRCVIERRALEPRERFESQRNRNIAHAFQCANRQQPIGVAGMADDKNK